MNVVALPPHIGMLDRRSIIHFVSLDCLPRRLLFASQPWLTRNYCRCHMPANMSISWRTKADEASDPTQKALENKIHGPRSRRRSKKAPQRQHSTIHMLLYSYSVRVCCSSRYNYCLNCTEKNLPTEAAIQVCTAGICTNRTGREKIKEKNLLELK